MGKTRDVCERGRRRRGGGTNLFLGPSSAGAVTYETASTGSIGISPVIRKYPQFSAGVSGRLRVSRDPARGGQVDGIQAAEAGGRRLGSGRTEGPAGRPRTCLSSWPQQGFAAVHAVTHCPASLDPHNAASAASLHISKRMPSAAQEPSPREPGGSPLRSRRRRHADHALPTEAQRPAGTKSRGPMWQEASQPLPGPGRNTPGRDPADAPRR